MRKTIGLALALSLATTAFAQDASAITLGNGEKNWIMVEGLTRSVDSTYTEQRITSGGTAVRRGDGAKITFNEVHIEDDGWLVLHPFIDGKPNGDWVAGYSFVESGTNKDVSITLNPAPEPGTMFLVMLHSDSNKDGVFDFVFVEDGINIEDRAVFEGNRMVAHVFAVP
ncbi:hypothetical protein [uncultured Erythrobacter sp.]|uniref:DUF7282 domain-containing protein n=1 Tax=uncultured Erythrobacter sp. TaxID=263913 RepID=UPI00260DBAB2|nr:hypothetical protein [uncultured Erythrobacter sp.]